MSATAMDDAIVTEQRPQAGIVCCSGDLCATVTADQLPWARLVVAIFVAAQTMTLGMTINITAPESELTLRLLQGGMLAATLVVLALLGLPLAVEAIAQSLRRRLTMELLFLIGIAAAMAISVWSMVRREGPVYFEVVNVLLVVYSVGHLITAHSRSKAIAASGAMLGEVSQARLADGRMIPAEQIAPGHIVRIMPGEVIPVDGIVRQGQSLVRSSAFTGEWQSRPTFAGDRVLAGSACEDGTLIVEATSPGDDRRIDALSRLIASACQSSSPLQRLADRFVRWFLPAVIVVAAASLLYWGYRGLWSQGIFNALAVVLVACPCAAGLAAPLAIWTAISRMAGKGLLLKSAESLQRMAEIDEVAFDKTGTLADERLEVKELIASPEPSQRRRAIAILAEIERHSEHPVAKAIRELPQADTQTQVAVESIRTLPARGIAAEVVLDGARRHVEVIRREGAGDLTLDASLDGTWIATVVLAEKMRESSAAAIARLTEMGLPVRIITGDSSAAAQRASHLAPVASGVTPEQKHSSIAASSARLLFVGDGVNDAAAMVASHASIAMSSGSAITVETADATLHGNDLCNVPEAVLLARQTVNTVHSNFTWAVAYNVIGMALAATGYLHPVVAGILMSVSSAVVAWRSFALAGKQTWRAKPKKMPAAVDAEDVGALRMPLWMYGSLHALGLIGQVLVLVPLASLGMFGASVGVLIAGGIAFLVTRFAHRIPAWLDMTLAMVSIGGLGMNLGWWIDLSFDPAVRNGAVKACCMIDKTMEAATLEASSHWMYWAMLIAGVPAMYLLRRGRIFFDWRKWCCSGMLLLGVPGMCFGMWAGAQLAMGLENLPDELMVVASYLLMMLGMCAGMLAPHSLELVRWRKPAA